MPLRPDRFAPTPLAAASHRYSRKAAVPGPRDAASTPRQAKISKRHSRLQAQIHGERHQLQLCGLLCGTDRPPSHVRPAGRDRRRPHDPVARIGSVRAPARSHEWLGVDPLRLAAPIWCHAPLPADVDAQSPTALRCRMPGFTLQGKIPGAALEGSNTARRALLDFACAGNSTATRPFTRNRIVRPLGLRGTPPS